MLRSVSVFRAAGMIGARPTLALSPSHFNHSQLLRARSINGNFLHPRAGTTVSAVPQFQKAQIKTRVTIKTKNYYGGSSSSRSGGGHDSDSSDDGKSRSFASWVPMGRKSRRKDSLPSVIDKFAKMIGNDVVLYVLKELSNTPELRNAVKATAKAVVLGVRKQLAAFTDFTLKQIGESTKQQKLDKNSERKYEDREEDDEEAEEAEHHRFDYEGRQKQQHDKQENANTRYSGSSTINKPNVYDILGLPRKANPRQILGVSENATMEEVKQAYHVLAKKWHPDTNTHVHANRVFTKIKKNYAILMEEMQRTHPSGGGFHT